PAGSPVEPRAEQRRHQSPLAGPTGGRPSRSGAATTAARLPHGPSAGPSLCATTARRPPPTLGPPPTPTAGRPPRPPAPPPARPAPPAPRTRSPQRRRSRIGGRPTAGPSTRRSPPLSAHGRSLSQRRPPGDPSK